MTPELAERIFDANVRVDGMWPFPFGEAPDALLSAFEYGDDDSDLPADLAALTSGWDDEQKHELFEGEGYTAREAWNELSGAGHRARVTGWIIRAECPVFQKHGDNGVSFSWGYYSTVNLFAVTAELAVQAACEWAESEHEKAVAA